MVLANELLINLDRPHPRQLEFIDSKAKRKVIRAGRRAGKTSGMVIHASESFLRGRRVLYGAPTADQVGAFWSGIMRAFQSAIDSKILVANMSEKWIELPGTKQRIRAKTCWNADTLRGDYADELILDEYQLMAEDTWATVGAPMLLDNNGNATFIYTPPSLRSRSASKAQDPMHAAKLFKRAQADKSGRWAVFHFTSMDNPHLPREGLEEITQDMTNLAYRMEVLAEDIEEAPGALWKRDAIDAHRVTKHPDLTRVVVAVDPTASATGDEAGIITAGERDQHYYTLADDSRQGSPHEWATAAVAAYHLHQADVIVAEKNNGGDMVEAVIKQVDPTVNVKLVWASRGKVTRAEPVAAVAEQGRDHHVGYFPALEDELCMWQPGDPSPNRLDAKVWAITELMDSKVVGAMSSILGGY